MLDPELWQTIAAVLAVAWIIYFMRSKYKKNLRHVALIEQAVAGAGGYATKVKSTTQTHFAYPKDNYEVSFTDLSGDRQQTSCNIEYPSKRIQWSKSPAELMKRPSSTDGFGAAFGSEK